LIGRPLVILSNNDGCIVARSAEAKALGIPMGAPAFHYRELFQRQKVIALSSNYILYGDMSHRVMSTLEQFGHPVDVYSIDEAFLSLPLLPPSELMEIGTHIRQTIKQWLGLPIAIGIAATQTLAKAANKIAKKNKQGVMTLTEENILDTHLAELLVEDIWGIGRGHSATLHKKGITTALQLKNCDDLWIKKQCGVQTLRTVWELRGIVCSQEEDKNALSKSLISSRSFTKPLLTLSELNEAIATFASIAGEKLRAEKACAGFVSVFLASSPFNTQQPYYSNAIHIRLPSPSAYTPDLILAAQNGLKNIFKQGIAYKKAGICLGEIIPEFGMQLDLWTPLEKLDKKRVLMEKIDALNQKWGKKSIFYAAEGVNPSWKPQHSRSSPHYTTSWKDLIKANLNN